MSETLTGSGRPLHENVPPFSRMPETGFIRERWGRSDASLRIGNIGAPRPQINSALIPGRRR